VDTVIWPPRLALVRHSHGTAYQMRLLKESPVRKTIQIKALPVAQGFLAFEHEYTSSVTDAHYVAGIQVRPLEGKRLPKGNVKVVLEDEPIIKGPIAEFLPDPDPFDCMRMRHRKKTENCFTANALINEEAIASMQIGFMAINRDKVEVYLSNLVVEEDVPLEIMIVSALYTTKLPEPKKD
jgi:hypothetical protein